MKDLTLITLYNYLVHQSVPGELYNLDIVKRHYFHYKAFYFALNSISRDKIKKIEFNSDDESSLYFKIEVSGNIDKIIKKFTNSFNNSDHSDHFELSIEKESESILNVIITGMKEDDMYETRFSEYRRNREA